MIITLSEIYYAGYAAYCNGTDLDPAEQHSDWQEGYDCARSDHFQTEARILTASAEREDYDYIYGGIDIFIPQGDA